MALCSIELHANGFGEKINAEAKDFGAFCTLKISQPRSNVEIALFLNAHHLEKVEQIAALLNACRVPFQADEEVA